MGCSSSKQTDKKNGTTAEPTSDAGDKTLLQQKAADAKDEIKEEVCKSCSGNGKDIMGKRCACPIGQALPGQSVPLKVLVLSATGLRNGDWVGKSDPYCTMEVSGKPTPQVDGKPESRFSTKVVDNNLSPEWNHDIDVGHYCVGDSITFVVKDNDPLKPDDPLGKVTVTSTQFFENGYEGDLQLSGEGSGSDAFLKVKIAVQHPRVTVGIVSARGLRNADWVGKSDPFCTCDIPGRVDAKFATKVVSDQLAPVWNHEAVIPLYRVEDPLCFTVKDSDPLKQDDFLGKLTLTHDQFLPNGFSGEVQLVSAGDGIEAFLTIDVVVGDTVEQPLDLVEPILAEEGKYGIVDTATERLLPEDLVDAKVAPQGLCC